MKIESSAFASGEVIPLEYTPFGANESPPLVFRDVPRETRSLALIVDEPEAPDGAFTHWIVFNLDPMIQGLKKGAHVMYAREGMNDSGKVWYGGPRPLDGERRYVFRLYALDLTLDCANDCRRDEIEPALAGHVLATAELSGRFGRPDIDHQRP